MNKLQTIPLSFWTFALKTLIYIVGLPIMILGGFFMFEIIDFAFELWNQMFFLKTLIYVVLIFSGVLYLFILFKVTQVIHQYEKHEIFSLYTQKLFIYSAFSAFIISIIYALLLPIFYIVADLDDAPGFVLIGLFFVVLAFALALLFYVISNIIKQASDLEEESKWVI